MPVHRYVQKLEKERELERRRVKVQSTQRHE
jgi:hypothetical protein